MNFDTLIKKIKTKDASNLVVVGAHEANVLKGVNKAAKMGIAIPVLIGDQPKIEKIAKTESLDLANCKIINISDMQKAALAAMKMVTKGEAGALMKGKISTPDFMRIGIKNGLKLQGKILSHLTVFQFEQCDRLIALTDAGVIPFPNLKQRVQIIKNAVEAMRILGVKQPKVAALSSTEDIDDKIPVSIDANELVKMNQNGGCLDGWGHMGGPMDLFSALDEEAAKIKGIVSTVAGKADILHCPDVVAGNLLGKAISYFSKGSKMGGCVIGGTVPIILLSRASTAADKYYSILLGLSCSPRIAFHD